MKSKSVAVAIKQLMEALPIILQAAEEAETERKRIREIKRIDNKERFGHTWGAVDWTTGKKIEEKDEDEDK